jgi:hypothetical protein
MKKPVLLISLLAAAMMINAAPSYSNGGAASDIGSMKDAAQEAISQKDECLLVAKNCPDSVDTIQQRIEKLQREINKGNDVYTSEELRILKQKLDDANYELNTLIEGR